MLTYGDAGLIALVTAVLVSAVWRSLKGGCQEASDELKDHSDNHPERAKANPPGHRYSNYDHPTEEEHRTAEQFNWRNTNALNICIAGVAVVAALFAAGSFIETRRQADAADATLKETRIANAKAENATRRQLRAYIGVTDAYIAVISPAPEGPALLHPIKFVLTEKNFGQTPAYHVYWRVHIRVLPDNDSKVFVLEDYGREKQGQLTVVEPGQHWDAPAILDPSPTDRQALMDKTKLIVAYGAVFYEDAFGNSRTTDFCWFIGRDDLHGSECQNHNDNSADN